MRSYCFTKQEATEPEISRALKLALIKIDCKNVSFFVSSHAQMQKRKRHRTSLPRVIRIRISTGLVYVTCITCPGDRYEFCDIICITYGVFHSIATSFVWLFGCSHKRVEKYKYSKIFIEKT